MSSLCDYFDLQHINEWFWSVLSAGKSYLTGKICKQPNKTEGFKLTKQKFSR